MLPDSFVAEVDGRRLCVAHWKLRGKPWPTRPSDPLEAARQAQKTRERMMARGGTSRHLVRSGRT
jgi:hypothetical protein